jgi:succinate dehydrogenase/fumarate reductase flavoprotein subunit
MRFDPRGLMDALVRAAGDVRLNEPFTGAEGPVVLATGGFAASPELVARYVTREPVALRASPWSAGDGLQAGLERGGALTDGMDQFYGRNMADVAFGESDYVRLAQLYARRARVVNERGEEFLSGPPTWSETDVVQATARQPGARAWYLLTEDALEEPDVRDRLAAAREAGAPVLDAADLPFQAPPATVLGLRVRAAITHTIGGLRVDERALVLGPDGEPIDHLYAAGVDAGGVSTGGYASGLAQALVLGIAAAEDALT